MVVVVARAFAFSLAVTVAGTASLGIRSSDREPWIDLCFAWVGVAVAAAVWPEFRLRPPRYDLRLWGMLAAGAIVTVWWFGFNVLR